MTPIHLDTFDLVIAAALVLLNAGISLWLRLQLHRQVLVAATRMVVQLLLVGHLLRVVFAMASPWLTLAVIAVMILAAAREVALRPSYEAGRGTNFRIAAAVVGLAGMATVLLALLTAIRPAPWYDPRYAIPLLGIVLGSVLNAASLGLDTFFSGVVKGRAAIEARLALGDTRAQAMATIVRHAMRTGLIPIVNQMSAAGIITLPGIMTGQMLAGMDPVESVKYQILLMFLLTGGSGLAALGTVFLAARSVTDERHRLRLDRLIPRR